MTKEEHSKLGYHEDNNKQKEQIIEKKTVNE